MKYFDVAVIGGGAAGSACAVKLSALKKQLKIVLIEAVPRLGKKLATTGNGQGNVSNTDMTPRHFRGGNIPLTERIACADPYAGTRLFNCLFSADDRGRIYPAGRQASSLCDNFINTLSARGVELMLSSAVTDIERGFTLTLSGGERIGAAYVVLCTGGVAQPVYKGSSPYSAAQKFGHKVTSLSPSLVQLKTDLTHIKTLKGIRADCAVTATPDGGKGMTSRGDVIFTEYGISGNAVFAVSPAFSDKTGTISLEFLPDIPAEDIERDIENKKRLGYADGELLSGTVHNQIGRAVVRRTGSADSRKLAHTLKNFTLKVCGNTGFDNAQVTRGGLDMSQIGDNLESKLVKNLFFAGEVLDVDGDCGGYNLQWAFTSGMYVAEEINRRFENNYDKKA